MKAMVYIIMLLCVVFFTWQVAFGGFAPSAQTVRQACAKHQGVQAIALPAMPFETAIIVCRDGKAEE